VPLLGLTAIALARPEARCATPSRTRRSCFVAAVIAAAAAATAGAFAAALRR
jgi:hypothetical protein